jgi:NADPH-dependent 2,4-dienoyl-CoA reductase/sulfur reductase-like enzyme
MLAWDGLVVATGLRPRRLGIPGPQRGRHVLRTLDDAGSLRAALAGARWVAVIGAGFIGCEIAALATGSGVEVHVIAPEAVPLERPCGKPLGDEIQRRLEALGIRFHLGVLAAEYLGDERVTGVALSDATKVDADVVVEAVGSVPNVEWLAGNGLDLTDGLLCAANLCVQNRPDVVACGDVARFPNLLFDRVPRRVEHWTMAVDTARRAGTTLAATLAGCALPEDPFTPVPSFWSHQDAVRLQSFGSPGLGGDDIRVLEGELEGEAAVGYHRHGELVGVILLGLAHRYAHYRKQVADIRGRAAGRSTRNSADGTR